MTPVLIDTNVFVYRLDAREPVKRARADELLRAIQPTGLGAVTTQVLGELFRVATCRLDPPLPSGIAVQLITDLAQSFPVLPIELGTVLEAVRSVDEHGLSYWDAQLWAAARLSGARVILSEDFNDGQTVEGITFRDPFGLQFSVEQFVRTVG